MRTIGRALWSRSAAIVFRALIGLIVLGRSAVLLVGLITMILVSAFPSAGKDDEARPSRRGLVVIAPEAFRSSLAEFLAHKQELLPSEFRSLETILAQNQGVDDPEKLKRYLYKEWKTGGVGYALLVGDVDVLPVRFMVLDRVTPAAFDYAFYPSDLYYGDLAKADGVFEDWNAQTNGFHAAYYGEVRGEKNKEDPINFDEIDYHPEIAVGRWPVSTPEQARVVAEKTMNYERGVLSGSIPELRNAAFFAVGGWVDSRPAMDSWAAKLTNSWRVEKRFYTERGHQQQTPPPDHRAVRSLFNQGLGLAVHTGHGQPDGWDQCFSLADLDAFTNGAAVPVVLSAGCSTAYFAPLPPYGAYVDVEGQEHAGSDHAEVFKAPPPAPAPYQRGKFNPTGLGEQLLKRARTGAVAYIGCNTGSQPCALTLAEGFVTALSKASEPRLGDCWVAALDYYFDREHLATLKPDQGWYPPSIFFQGMKFMLFGDPSLCMPAAERAKAHAGL